VFQNLAVSLPRDVGASSRLCAWKIFLSFETGRFMITGERMKAAVFVWNLVARTSAGREAMLRTIGLPRQRAGTIFKI
jgi:hypothetical protein